MGFALQVTRQTKMNKQRNTRTDTYRYLQRQKFRDMDTQQRHIHGHYTHIWYYSHLFTCGSSFPDHKFHEETGKRALTLGPTLVLPWLPSVRSPWDQRNGSTRSPCPPLGLQIRYMGPHYFLLGAIWAGFVDSVGTPRPKGLPRDSYLWGVCMQFGHV